MTCTISNHLLSWGGTSSPTCLQVHFAEEWNELHHLQIMESLGGDQLWWDRFLAQHAAVFYYWVLILFYTLAPRMAYVFSELVEVSRHSALQLLLLACGLGADSCNSGQPVSMVLTMCERPTWPTQRW